MRYLKVGSFVEKILHVFQVYRRAVTRLYGFHFQSSNTQKCAW